MNSLSVEDVVSPLTVGLAGSSLKHPDQMRILLSYATETQPRCRVLAKLQELHLDLIGPMPLGARISDLITKERPNLVNLRIDENNTAIFRWIPKIWNDHRVPVVVVTMSDDPTVYTESIRAGAFGVTREDSSIQVVQSLFTACAVRGAALRDAQDRIDQLERNLSNRRLVEQAKWILVQRDSITEPEAHIALQNIARNTRSPLADIAKTIIESDGSSRDSSAKKPE